jgi:hypothetical protein
LAQRKNKRSDSGKSATAKTEPPKTDASIPDGVLVQLVPDGEGGQTMNIQGLGAVKVTELPTLLRQAANHCEKQLGAS